MMFIIMWGTIFNALNNYHYFSNFTITLRKFKLIVLIVEANADIGYRIG